MFLFFFILASNSTLLLLQEYTRVHVIVGCLSYILEEFVTFEFFEDVTLVLH